MLKGGGPLDREISCRGGEMREGGVAAATKTRGGTENAASIYTTRRGSANFPAVQRSTTQTDIIMLLALKTETIMALGFKRPQTLPPVRGQVALNNLSPKKVAVLIWN